MKADILDTYDYILPPELIAHEPNAKRDDARLFVYRTSEDVIEFKKVSDLPDLIRGSVCIFNDTKVLPARLQGFGNVNDSVELLILVDQGYSETGIVRSLVNRFTPIGEVITAGSFTFTVIENSEKSMRMKFSGSETELRELLSGAGETPLPPYIRSTATESEKRTQYQTVFAEDVPSVAAPTASLHFTPELLARMSASNIALYSTTLQVGLGTFAPIFAENFESRSLHRESYFVPETTAQAILDAKATHRQIVAIGTTVVRTLESAKDSILNGAGAHGETEIFIFPPYTFSVPDALMTNFHVPRSSLMCMVDAFLQHKKAERNITELYKVAINERFRFYSFGDAMLLL